MDRPMPFALSRIRTAAHRATETNTTDNNIPQSSSMMPEGVNAYSTTGMPTPMRKANAMAPANPVNILNHIVRRFNGWLTSNSINSALLYRYTVEKMMLTKGTTNRMIFSRLTTPLSALSSILNTLNDNTSSAAAYTMAVRLRNKSAMTYFTI